MLARVLANIEGRHLKPERLHRPAHPGQGTVGNELATGAAERLGHQVEVGDEILGMRVVQTLDVGQALLQPPVGVDQAGPDVGALEAIGLSSRAPTFALPDLGQHLAIRFQGLLHLVTHRGQTLGH